jgi:hypothetical protein
VKRPAVWLALALLLLTAALLTYRIVWLGYPVFPTAPGRTWQLLIDAHIKGGSGETTLALAVPNEMSGRMLVEERVISGALTRLSGFDSLENYFHAKSHLISRAGDRAGCQNRL